MLKKQFAVFAVLTVKPLFVVICYFFVRYYKKSAINREAGITAGLLYKKQELWL